MQGYLGRQWGCLHIKASILSLFQAKLRTSSLLGLILPVLSSSPEGVADLVFHLLLLVPCVQKQCIIKWKQADLIWIGIEEMLFKCLDFLC